MSIRHAILGFLSWRPLAGYDLKKLFADSPLLHWSGNNNQIYRTLVQLHRDELVSVAVKQQESRPARKTYSITEQGQRELRSWVLTTEPQLPRLRSTFLVQLAWSDQLSAAELDDIVGRYEHEVHMQLLMVEEQLRRGMPTPERTPRETYLWRMIGQNRVAFYRTELEWVRELRAGLAAPATAADSGGEP